MSHIRVRKIAGSRYSFGGREWWYEFGPEISSFGEETVKRFIDNKSITFSSLTKKWNDELNTEWVCRIFWAVKMILASSLMLESLEYARDKNLKVCIPYLQYYSLLYSLKALVVVLPNQQWDKGTMIKQNHKITINIACDEISKLDKSWNKSSGGAVSVKEQILKLKAFREFISYRAPSSGGGLKDYNIDVINLCKIPVELAQMVTELLEESLFKHMPNDYKPQLLDSDLDNVFMTTIENEDFRDEEDEYRIGYLYQKHPLPTNIVQMMSEGHVGDFFGSWCDAKRHDDSFNPDENWRILFNVP